MTITKTIGFLGVLLAVTLLAQNASALPNSSLNEWEGSRTYSGDGFNVLLEWAVYTMADNPWASTITFDEGDNYIYAYQIFNQTPSEEIGYFSVLDIAGNPISQSVMNGTQAVLNESWIMPINPSATEGEWVWAEGAYVSAGQRSTYLVFSSPNAPTRGKFTIEAPEEDPPVPEVPEPATLLLLGVASTFILTKRRKTQQTK